MNNKATRGKITGLLIQLLEKNILLDYKPPIIRDGLHNQSAITWADAPTNLFDTLSGDYCSLPEYRYLLEKGYYHGLLFDGSIIQLCCLFQGNDLIKHRFLYYPCPIIFPEDELGLFQSSIDVLHLLDLYITKEAKQMQSYIENSGFQGYCGRLRLFAPIRFDYDLKAKKINHSASHMTVNNEDCRIPVFGPISEGLFIRFILRNFYPQKWEDIVDFQNISLDCSQRSITKDEMFELYFDCVSH